MSKRIDEIRVHPGLCIDGINYGSVIATELYDLSIRGYIKHLAKCLLYNFKVTYFKHGSRLFEYSLGYANRNDYKEIRDHFMDIIPNLSYLDIDRYKSKKMFIFKLFRILRLWIKFLFSKVKTPFLCAILVAEYSPLKAMIKKTVDFNEINTVITFCDARCEDNMLAQLSIKNKVRTVTLQHGQYRIIDDSHETAEVEAYKNFISDYLLAWGNATKDEFIKYGINQNRIIPVGALKGLSFLPKMRPHAIKKIFGIVLCSDANETSNIAMIKMANQLCKKCSLKYYVRFHPRNKKENYFKHIANEYLEGYSANIKNMEYTEIVDFSIIHMTGVFVELLGLNSIIFLYEDEFLEDIFKIKPYTFRDQNELLELYHMFLKGKNDIEEEQFKYYYYFNNARNVADNYRNALSIIEGLQN